MLDTLLAMLSAFDWVTPITAYVGDLVNGPSHTFHVPHDCGRSGRWITHMLSGYGIRTWGGMIVNGSILFTVRQSQARWAQYLLQRQGVPITSGLWEAAKSARRRGALGAFLADWLG